MLQFPGVTAGDIVTLAPGETQLLSPAGNYVVSLSEVHTLQVFDQTQQAWQSVGSSNPKATNVIYSDGVTTRIANLTGCAVGALITNGGSAYTSAPTVTASAGGSAWRAIVGGAISTSVTVTNAGAGYTYAPEVAFSPPPNGGLQATGYCTLSGGTVASVTVTNQGAGYITPPTISFQNDPRELNQLPGWNYTVGYNAAATCTLTGAGTITGLICTDFGGGGGALTALPTLSFSGGGGSSAAATVIMCWTITAVSISTPGSGLSGSRAMITALDNFPTTAAAYTNPKYQNGLVAIRNANIAAAVASTSLSGTPVIYDGGIYTSSPTMIVIPNASVATTAPVVAATLGGSTGHSYVVPIGF